MTKRVEKAMELHKKGYNCAQAVACSFCDVVQMDEDTLFRVTEAFGGGMGGMKGTCGAISGACAVAGLLRSEGKEQCKSKAQTYKLSKALLSKFRRKTSQRSVRSSKVFRQGHRFEAAMDALRMPW